MIRIFCILGAVIGLLTACGDGRGSQYSSARGHAAPASYIPVTPGATPIGTSVGAPAGAAAPASGAGSTAVLTGPVAITPGAQPILASASNTPVQVIPASVPGMTTSLAPTAAPWRGGNPAPTQAVAVTPAPTQQAQTQRQPQSQTQRQTTRASAPARKSQTRRAGQKYARGVIYTACREARRDGATDKRCGCVQWVADSELNTAQQRRGAGYFKDQQGLQEARQSDSSTNERFWKAWKSFGTAAGQQCSRS